MQYPQYNDPLYILWRKGDISDPYAHIVQNHVIVNNMIVLHEIPDEFSLMDISGYEEIKNGTPENNQFKVNYQLGIVEFNATENGNTVNVDYMGRGLISYPAERIYVHSQDNDVVNNLQDIIDNGQGGIDALVQLNAKINGLVFCGDYTGSTTYQVDNTVRYDDAIYRCTQETTGNLPTDVTYWAEVLSVATELADVVQATADANLATSEANTARDEANTARDNANTATTDANTARDEANTARDNANTATSEANTARDEANAQATFAQTQGNYAQTQGNYAQTQGDYALAQGDYANTQGAYAQTQGDYAKNAADELTFKGDYSGVIAYKVNNSVKYNNAIYRCILDSINNLPTDVTYWAEVLSVATELADVVQATSEANTARDGANTARDNANTATTDANTARDEANTARDNANTATSEANTARDEANAQATFAQTQGNYAQTQGDYALAQGDYANTQGAYAQTQGDHAKTEGDRAQVIADEIRHLGKYSSLTSYVVHNSVEYNGSTYICILDCTGVNPTNTSYWAILAQKGADGVGDVNSVNGYTGDIVLNSTDIGAIPASEKGVNSGVASLDSNGKIPLAQLPDTSRQQTYVVVDSSERVALIDLIEGDKAFETATGDTYIYDGAAWQLMADADWQNVNIDWNNINNPPTSYMPSTHSHLISDVADFNPNTKQDILPNITGNARKVLAVKSDETGYEYLDVSGADTFRVKSKTFAGVAGQTVFDVTSAGAYDPGKNRIQVYVGTLRLLPSFYTETSSTIITLNNPLVEDTSVYIEWYELTKVSSFTADWLDINGKPAAFTPTTHSHTSADVTGVVADSHLSDNNPHSLVASDIDVTDSGGLFTATNVEDTLSELHTSINSLNATSIPITDSAGNFTATDTEGALAELFTSVSNGKVSLETAITDMSGTVSKAGAIATFAELESGIRGISTGKKFMSGSTSSNTITVSGLGWNPRVVVIVATGSTGGGAWFYFKDKIKYVSYNCAYYTYWREGVRLYPTSASCTSLSDVIFTTGGFTTSLPGYSSGGAPWNYYVWE